VNNSLSRIEYLAKVASLYYDRNKKQQEIADELGVTRSLVSRLLTEARETGIVEIIVHYPWRTNSALETELISQFGLKAARVLVRENKSFEEMLSGLGVLAAEFFLSILDVSSVVGISWGSGLYHLVRAIRPRSMPKVEVVQLMGGSGTETHSIIGPLLAPMLANSLDCTCRYLHAPLVCETENAKAAFLEERSIRETLALAQKADIALVGIGSTNPDLYNPLRLGYVGLDDLRIMREQGIIGDVCAQHFLLDGTVVDTDLNRRTIGVRLQDLANVEYVIGVAGDIRKAQAIHGALNKKYINVLITDDQAATEVLKIRNNFTNSKK
jgi:deoxyribonucleoside regulator